MISTIRIIAAVAVFFAVAYLGYWFRDRSVANEIMVAENAIKEDCNQRYEKLKEKSHEIQKSLSDSNDKLANLKRVWRGTVIDPIVSSERTNRATTTDPRGPQNGTRLCRFEVEELLELAGRCDTYRIRAQACADHLNDN